MENKAQWYMNWYHGDLSYENLWRIERTSLQNWEKDIDMIPYSQK